MYKVVPLVLLFSVLLLGVSFTQNSYAAPHTFELEWGISGIAKPGMFLSPQHLAVDSDNNVYVTDLGNARVQKFDDQGNYIRSWGLKGFGPGEFSAPSGIAVANGYVFVVDNTLDTVQKFDSFGNFVMQWGGFGLDDGKFRMPTGIAISDDEFVYVIDTGNNRIQKFTFNGEHVFSFGQSGKKIGDLLNPTDIAISKTGKIFVTDTGNQRINIYTNDGTPIRTLNHSVGGFYSSPSGIILDENNNFYITDVKNNRIIQFNEYGSVLSIFGIFGNEVAQFRAPQDVALDNNGFLYITDTMGHRIQKFLTPIAAEKAIVEEALSEQKESISELEEISETQTELPEVNPIPNDFTKPTISVPENIVIEATGALTSVNIGKASADDESGILSLSNNVGEEFPLGITTVIWTAIDGSGNMAIASQSVTVQDTTSPEVEQLTDITLEAKSDTQNLVKLKTPDAYDAVGIISIDNDAPNVFSLGETNVTWTITDVMQNISTMQQKVILIDSDPPRVDIIEDIIVEATSINENTVSLIEPEVFDHVKVISLGNDAPQNFSIGETTVTWMVTDSSGNTGTSSHKVIVKDTTPPEILVNDLTIEATVSSGSDVLLQIPEINDIQEVSITNDAPDVLPFGETIVTWIVKDQSGNESSQIQNINVIDTTNPILIMPNDIEIESTGIETTINNLGELIAEDISEISSISNDAPESFPLGETIVSWTATDTSGNSSSSTQLVTVVDTTAPQIIAPSDIKLEAVNSIENYVELTGGSVFDTVEIKSITNDAPESFPLGETIVTWTATDTSGNSSTFFQSISIIDTTAPEVIPPENIIQEAENISSNFVVLGNSETYDIVDVSSITNDAPESFPLGETIVTWTATDTSGNSSSSTQLVTVEICGNSSSYYNFIIGTAEDDFLIGTALPDLIFGYGGDDIIIGNNGNDCIFAGEGSDIIFGNSGDDTITSGQGNDIIKGNSGEDILNGGLGLDMIDGGDDIDTCVVIEEQNSDLVVKCEISE